MFALIPKADIYGDILRKLLSSDYACYLWDQCRKISFLCDVCGTALLSHSLAFVATPFVGHRAMTRSLGLRLRALMSHL